MPDNKNPIIFPDLVEANSITQWLSHTLGGLTSDKILYPVIVVAGLIVLLGLMYLTFRFLIFRPIASSSFAAKRMLFNQLLKSRILGSLAAVVGLIVVDIVLDLLPNLSKGFYALTDRVITALLIFAVAQTIVRGFRFGDAYYSSLSSVNREGAFRGYVTVGSFLVYGLAVILILATLMGKSPAYFLTGLGAMSAVLLIVFRDTLLSMFANVIVTTGDLVRVGDWIAVSGTDADGTVTDVSLNVVKVQNFDHTVTSLPTYTLVQSSFTNWRGMFDSGGRRIKRSLLLDQRTIRTLSANELEQLAKLPLVDQALTLERESVTGNPECANGLLVTNSGLFRQYCLVYLQQHPKIHHDGMTLLVRQLEPTETGIPLQLYCFTTDTRWAFYEAIQASIFDHLLSLVPVFGLRVFQTESDFAEPEPQARTVDLAPNRLVPAWSSETQPNSEPPTSNPSA
ncbi:MAG: mechanosensitive ion channel protein MscS [Halochromatium sp.]|nr:mechanosensitive ion channel protein MscS [Halochromatium sp.]